MSKRVESSEEESSNFEVLEMEKTVFGITHLKSSVWEFNLKKVVESSMLVVSTKGEDVDEYSLTWEKVEDAWLFFKEE